MQAPQQSELDLDPAKMTLDDLSAAPERVAELSSESARSMLTRGLVAVAVLKARVGTEDAEPDLNSGDRLVDRTYVARCLDMSEDWVYDHANELPFTIHQGRQLKFSLQGLQRYIRDRQGR